MPIFEKKDWLLRKGREREREKSNLLTHAHLKFGLAIKSRT